MTIESIAPEDKLREPLSHRSLIFLLALGILIADFFVLDLVSRLQAWFNLPQLSEWNWYGKTMSIAFSCLVLACSPWLRCNVGLRWRQSPGSLKLSLAAFLA